MTDAPRKLRNVTITLDESAARWARVRAAEQGKSLSRFMADLLSEKMTQDPEYRAAYERFLSVKPVRLREPGEKLPTREELYDRKVFRR
jgi:hypothetical protein